jgi:hypothetical protein
MEREAERIQCRDNAGKNYTIVVYQRYVDAGTVGDDSSKWVKTTKRGTLTDGRHVNRIDDDTSEIVETGEVIKRV